MFDKYSIHEPAQLLVVVLAHAPILWVDPVAYVTLVGCAIQYAWVHAKSHRDPSWATKHIPWHYEHHIGKNQNANYGVRKPWIDYLLKTRVDMGGKPKSVTNKC